MTDDPQRPERRTEPRQKVERVRGSRRARLTPVVGTDTAPETAERREPPASGPKGPKGPNDDRMLRDVPPHY